MIQNVNIINSKSFVLQYRIFMKQIISLHFGQAGIRIGEACWQLYAQQHGLTLSGIPTDAQQNPEDNKNVVFYVTASGKYTPRTVYVDCDPTSIDEVRKGPLRDLFSHSQFMSDKQSANVFIRGAMYGFRNEELCELVRKQAQKCQQLQGLLYCNSLGGGMSGLECYFPSHVSDELLDNKKVKFGVKVHPSPNIANSIVEPYNGIHSMHHIIQSEDFTFLVDNEALYDLCSHSIGIDNPSYADINKLIARATASVTSSMRFRGTLNADLEQLRTNLVPYSRIHFLVPSFSTSVRTDDAIKGQSQICNLTNNVFNASNQMLKCDPSAGQYMACSLLYQGMVNPNEVIESITKIKARNIVNFVDWSPTGFKVGINSCPQLSPKNEDHSISTNSCCLLSNTTAVSRRFDSLLRKFQKMFRNRAFVHYYNLEGMETEWFSQSEQDMLALQADYQEIVEGEILS